MRWNRMGNYDDIKNVISTFSGTERHITVPRVYLELLGDFNTAAFLNQLIFWSDKTKRRDGFFYKTYAEWEDELFLSEYQVRRSSKNLRDLGLIETEVKRANGSPTVHYKVNMEKLSESILNKLKNRNQTNSINDSEVSLVSLTVDDTLDEQTVDSNKSSNSTRAPYKEIIEYLNEKADRKYKHSAKLNQRVIKARFNEGYDIDDFKSVIDKKTTEWNNDAKMRDYLRPETLFGTKFDRYLNEDLENKSEPWLVEDNKNNPLWDVSDL